MFRIDMDDLGDYKAQALVHIRRESLDLYNRLHSVAEDLGFVNAVVGAYPDLPVLPNLRCGAWYVDPSIARKEPAYFKSTDGHFNNWSFNLRRPNLHLLPVVVEHHGFIIVDSTRAGKRMPDALSKTVPIWCAVINRAVQIAFAKDTWDAKLYTPPGIVSAQEHVQIEVRLDGWARNLLDSSYVLPNLVGPLRPIWITPATSTFPQLPLIDERPFSPIICLSASKQIEEGLERRSRGFSYVQGSGDDHELWGMGLTPSFFWKHKDALLSADRDDIEDLVTQIISQQPSHARLDWAHPPTPIHAIGDRLLICAVDDLPSTLPSTLSGTDEDVAYVLLSDRPQKSFLPKDSNKIADTSGSGASMERVLFLGLSEGKKGQLQFLGFALPRAIPYVKDKLSGGIRVCVCCDSGKDASVGVVLTALQLFFDDEGKYVSSDEQRYALANSANKKSIATRLQWIIASRPQANPSRATLKRVNEYILTPPLLRREYHPPVKAEE